MNISGKIKKKLLYASLIILLIIIVSYQFSFKKTIILYNEYNLMQEEKSRSQNLPQKITKLQNELDNISGTIESSNNGSNNKRNQIINRVSNYCDSNSIIISELTPSIIREENTFTIETNIIKIEGSFINLLKLLNVLEQEKSLGKVISVKFATYLNRKTRKKKLFSEIYIQNITNKKK
jgi:alpha-N-acetylglucosamine transferase